MNYPYFSKILPLIPISHKINSKKYEIKLQNEKTNFLISLQDHGFIV